jgi:hypothetical protein
MSIDPAGPTQPYSRNASRPASPAFSAYSDRINRLHEHGRSSCEELGIKPGEQAPTWLRSGRNIGSSPPAASIASSNAGSSSVRRVAVAAWNSSERRQRCWRHDRAARWRQGPAACAEVAAGPVGCGRGWAQFGTRRRQCWRRPPPARWAGPGSAQIAVEVCKVRTRLGHSFPTPSRSWTLPTGGADAANAEAAAPHPAHRFSGSSRAWA